MCIHFYLQEYVYYVLNNCKMDIDNDAMRCIFRLEKASKRNNQVSFVCCMETTIMAEVLVILLM